MHFTEIWRAGKTKRPRRKCIVKRCAIAVRDAAQSRSQVIHAIKARNGAVDDVFRRRIGELPDREQAVRRIGAYATLDEAVLAARREIDESLAVELAPCIPLARLSARYQSHGEAPIIFRDDDDKTINAGAFNPGYSPTLLVRRGWLR
jgi:hypothetical protein